MSNNATSNVIAMREFDRPVPSQHAAQFEHLLKECQDLAVDRLSRSVAAMLDKVEDTLWGLANQTMDRELRDLYVHVKDLALSQRKRIESEFRADYLAEFESRTRRDKRPKEAFSQFELGSLELGLVNDDDLEETLKINDMATKLRRYCDEELAALDQRIGVLVGDANLQGEANPLSPQAICSAFKQTCRSLEPNLKARMILHKLFDDNVLDDIRPIFKDLNTLLVDRSCPRSAMASHADPAAG
jgi:exonuclease VII small subunit